MYLRIGILYFLIIAVTGIYPQNRNKAIDSLKALLEAKSGIEKVDLMYELGTYYLEPLALERIKVGNEIIRLSEKLKYKEGLIKGHIHTGRGYYYTYKPDSSLLFLQKADDLLMRSNNQRLKAVTLGYIGDSQERKLNFLLANEYHHKSLEISESIKDTLSWGETANNIALNHWRLGEYPEAEKYFRIYLDLSRKLRHLPGIADALNNLGVLKWNWGKYYDALVMYMEALKTRQQIRDTSNSVVTMNNISLIYQKLGDSLKAYEYLTRSLKLAEKTQHKFSLAYTHENLGNYYLLKGNYDKAYDHFTEALNSYTDINFRAGITDINNALGNLYFSQEDYNKALPYFRTAYERSSLAKDKKAMIASLNNLGKVFIHLKMYDDAENSLTKANLLAKEAGIIDYLKDTYKYLAELYELKGMTERAYPYLKAFTEVNDSLFSIETSTMINQIKEQYDTESKERENVLLRNKSVYQGSELEVKNYVLIFSGFVFVFFIVLAIVLSAFYRGKKRAKEEVERLNENLKEANIRLKESENELMALNKAKAKFFSIIAHDLKNPFHVMMGFSEILYEGYEDFSDTEKRDMIKGINETSENAQKLLSNLLEWARFQTGKLVIKKEKTDISALILKEAASFTQTAKLKNVTLSHRLSPNSEIVVDREMVSTVIRNLVANALKFTPENGSVEISARSDNEWCYISVRDTGIGMQEQTVKNLFSLGDVKSLPGTAGEKGTGLGLILSREFIEEHGGRLKVESTYGAGSTFIIMLPLERNQI